VDGTLSIGPPIRGLTVVRSIVPAVRGFDGRDVLLEGGDRIQPDAVIAATGYVHGLERLVGNLGVLNDRGQPLVHGAATHPSAPGLHIIGFSNPFSGNLREIAIDVRRIAKALRAA